ncbi:MAG: cysteine--1-D-myo-inosityl 2-amino-2-deoxy-alpha-D-glucopyranoside ligase, partial [Promicromonosporaceae bacterium]|nr:cysteine--1-D-myo-inosityl 2-amino-2-deoxy-alpha-D-glucopyranoside ligase [Promicromonosporaceae bacterium]
PDVVAVVTQMLADGTAYFLDGDVYADLSADPHFGEVAGLDPLAPETLAVFGERGGDPQRPGKRHPLDPALWRAEQPGEPAWEGGVLGAGRPGWHIECAVIAREGLGLPFDVQGGGADLRFPHHEMSSSHARLLGGAARRHMHAGLVAYQGEKMSKSRGNLVFVSRLLEAGTDPMALRLALLAHHYRDEWEWTDADLAGAAGRLAAWRAKQTPDAPAAAGDMEMIAQLRSALRRDLDAPAAIAAIDAAPAIGPDLAHAIDALLGLAL